MKGGALMLDKNSEKILNYLKEKPNEEINIIDFLSLGLSINEILDSGKILENKGYIYILGKKYVSPRYKLRKI